MGKLHLPLLSCLMMISLLQACQKSEPGSKSFDAGTPFFGVGETDISPRGTTEILKINGVFIPSRQVAIKSEFSGRVEDVAVAKGQLISTGESLLRIEDDNLPQDLERLGTELQAAQAQLEQTRQLASQEPVEEEAEEEPEEFVQRVVPEAMGEDFSEPAPTFSQLASEIRFTPVDAGGVWPDIAPQIIAVADDPQDAGGIWPSYGTRGTVTGAGFSAAPESPPLVASLWRSVSSPSIFSPSNSFLPELPEEETSLETATDIPQTTEISEIQSRLAFDQARVDVIRAEIALRETELVQRSLSSPVSGRVHDMVAAAGSQVEPGDFLMEIYQVDPIEFSFNISTSQVQLLEVGMEIRGQVLDASDLRFEAEISFIGAELNADSKTVIVRARVDNFDDAFKTGMKGSGEILVK